MVASTASAVVALGRKARVAVLQPFLKHASRRDHGAKLPRANSHADACSKLDEAVALVDTLGCEVVLKEVVPFRAVHPKYMFGTGKMNELWGALSAADADMVFVNASLSGLQQKNMVDLWKGSTVLDRFRVILDIFADRARTTEAQLQVELAGLKYEAARLVQSGGASKGRDSGYDRQRGGVGAMGGSGEKALETQRRLLRDRMAEVNRQLKDVERRRGFQRGARNRRLEPTVALVGYTNVGKSSLLNRLALSRHSAGYFGEMSGNGSWESGGKGSGGTPYKPGGRGVVAKGKGMVHARNRVFDTLDPTVRSITLPSRARCVLVDTVGFIQDLPTDLVHAFRATLEEVRCADLLLHIRDASVEPLVYHAQLEAVEETLKEIGAEGVPTLEVWNKVDKGTSPPESDVNELPLSGNPNPKAPSERDGTESGSVATELRGEEATLGDMTFPEEVLGLGQSSRMHEVDRDAEGGWPEAAAPAVDGEGPIEGGTQSPGDSVVPNRSGPLDEGAVRVSAATGEGLGFLLQRVDALLHLNPDNRRFAPRPLDRYRYVRVLPGQSQR